MTVLYSFRRCPYAMRARLAIRYSGVRVELREIVLRQKPAHMLEISPKGTVPVLQLSDGQVIDESLDIMYWAIAQNDPDRWNEANFQSQISELIKKNDEQFKPWLDRYKYADRYPEQSEAYYRQQCEEWISQLESQLKGHKGGLISNQLTLADMAILPFVRQFAHVDLTWFESTNYSNVQQWLDNFKQSELFTSIMRKYPLWEPDQTPELF